MRSHRSLALIPVFVAVVAMPIGAAVETGTGGTGTTTSLTPEQQAFWNDVQKGGDVIMSRAQVEAEAKYVQARAEFQAAHFTEARDQVEAALRIFPSHPAAQQLRQDVLAVLSVRDNRLQMCATWLHAIQDVKTQELVVRMQALLESGDRKMATGDYAGAELDYDRVVVSLNSFPYQFDWKDIATKKDLPKVVEGKRLEARAHAREAELAKQAAQRQQAARAAGERINAQELALKAKVDELLRRARIAYSREDYKRAEVEAWNAYELDRRRDDARTLYLKARRGGHVQFDDNYREQRLERLARTHEEIHKAMIPQNELLVYPEDWQIRALRKPQELGSGKEEPWMAALRDRLEQRVTFEFADTGFDDVINFLRQVTGVTIVTAPDVTAGGGGTVTLKVKDMRFGDALKWILELTGLNMALQNQAIFISKTPITGAVMLRMYDVTDLISPVRDFPGREMAFNAGGGGAGQMTGILGGGNAKESAAPDPAELVEFIQKNVAPTSWQKEGVGIEQRAGSTLFVSQVPEVHTLIEQLLANLRNQQSLQVHVNVRLLDVKKGFFEEIGFNWTDTPVFPPTPNIIDGVPNNLYNGSAPANALGLNGYQRLASSYSFSGNVLQNLPANATQANWSSLAGGIQHGLVVDGSYHPLSFINQDQLNVIFGACEEETDSQIVQAPSITCFNGQRASCTFVLQHAYISDYDIVNYTFDPKIDVLNTGNILDVRPVVSSDRKYVTMEIRPTSVVPVSFYVENLTAPRFAITGTVMWYLGMFIYPLELPLIQVSTLRTSVMMPDKGTVMLGGYTNSMRQRIHSGIPFLSHIPFLGRLFSKNGIYDENRQLYYLLGVEIVDLGEKEKLQ
jgi:type II secretory pathway component GspD/PulD (secretin)